jgi:uncharacterized protein (DUF305 family)
MFLVYSNKFKLRFVIKVALWRRWPLAACTLAFLLSLPVSAQQTDPASRRRGEKDPSVVVQKDAPVVVQPGAPGQPTKTLPASTRATLQPPSPADVQFMQHMIVHHAQAVEMTALIESHTENKEIRTLGERISRSQSDEMKFMTRWLQARGEPTSEVGSRRQEQVAGGGHTGHAPTMESSEDHHMLMPGMLTADQMDALRKAKGKEFDRLFLSGMIQHHNGALVMVKELFNTPGAGEDAELFNFASDVDSGQRAEIRAMEKFVSRR